MNTSPPAKKYNRPSPGHVPAAAPVPASFRFLQTLAAEMTEGRIEFPTFVNATMNVRRVLQDPFLDTNRLAQTISGEPLLAAKVVHAANSAALGAPGQPVADVKAAVLRVGQSMVQTLAISVAMSQLVAMKEMRGFVRQAEAIWRHSLEVAAISHLLAARLTKLNPEEAMFAGLVHDIGKFYLLSRVAKYPELAAQPLEVEALLAEWHAPIGHAFLVTLGLPEPVLKAVEEHEGARWNMPLKTLSDVVNLANRASRCANPLNGHQNEQKEGAEPFAHPEILELLDENAEALGHVISAFRA